MKRVFAVLLLALLLTACLPPTTVQDTSLLIPLGNSRNSFAIKKTVFAGHRVDHFRLRLRFATQPARTWQWPSNVTMTIADSANTQNFTFLPATAASDGSFWTNTIQGNSAQISLNTNPPPMTDFDASRLRLEIVSFDRNLRTDSSREDVVSMVAGSANTSVLELPIGREVIAFSPGPLEAQHYRIAPANAQRDVSLYLSPFAPAIGNEAGIQLALSPSGFKSVRDHSGWLVPTSGDTGIYHEFIIPAGQTTFVTIRTVLPAPYFVTFQQVRLRFWNVRAGRHKSLGKAPSINLAAYQQRTSVNFPYGFQLSRYIRTNADFDRRIHETFVIASAHMLDSSEGMFRLREVRLWRQLANAITPLIKFRRGNDRAYASGYQINMYEGDLVEPLSAGWTLHHEWGHAIYYLPDEYLDVYQPPPGEDNFASEAIDANTLMGTRISTEFCGPWNHRWAPRVDIDEESNWSGISSVFGVTPTGVETSDYNQGRYLDVLHQLHQLLNFQLI